MPPPATSPALSTRVGLLAGRSPLMRIQSDERLIALIRAGNDGAFELLFERYRPRLLAFCRHMLASREDAEDVLQDLFTAAYNAIRADNREINARPWLYRIARNRCLNHLRRPTFDGRDTMDDQVHSNGTSTADIVHRRVDFRHLLDDIQKLPESQRTALLLREMDALSYDQIAEAMDNTVPSVKSLLVRARISLAEAAEARKLSCHDARRQLAEITEGLRKTTPALRRHVRACEDCRRFRREIRKTTTAMALVFPVGILAIFKKLALAKLGAAAAGGGGAASSGAAASGLAAGGTGTAAGTAASTALPYTVGAVATKAIAVTTATALLAGGAVEVHKITSPPRHAPSAQVQQMVHAPLARAPASVFRGPVPKAAPAKETHRKSKPDRTKAKAKSDAAVAKPVEATGATGTTGTTVQGGPTSGGATGGTGSSGASGATPPETGGASVPPPQTTPPEAAGSEVQPPGPAGGEPPPPAPPPPSPAPPAG